MYSSAVSESQRDRILARRARFVALALSASGVSACHQGDGVAERHDTVYLPPAEMDASTTATVDAGAEETGGVAVVEAGPPADAGISPATQERYARFAANAASVAQSIDALDAKVTKMGNYGPANATAWRDVVGEIQDRYSSIGYFSIYCPKPRPETDAFLAHVQDEAQKLRARVDALKKKAEGKLADKTTKGDARYDQLIDQYNNANPRPCLSIACDSW